MFKGYFSSRKPDGSPVEFVTVEPIRAEQNGLSVLAHQFMRSVGNDAAEANTVEGIIEATAHAALKGDVINITSGALAGYESKVWKVEANLIYLADALTLALGDTFEILRHKYPAVDDSGNLLTTTTQGPTQFVLDGVDTEVERDTVTPANSNPFPVINLDNVGVPVDFATQTTLAALLTAFNAEDFATETTLAAFQADFNGTDFATETTLDSLLTAFNAEDFASETSLAALLAAFNAEDFATETTLAAVLAKIIAAPATEAKQDTIITGLGSLLTELQQKTEPTDTQPISAASLPLPTGAATQTTLAALLTELQLKADLTETQPVSLASVPLPTGAATEATLASLAGEDFSTETTLAALSAKFNSLGQKTMANSAPVVIASDQSAIPASQSGNWSVRAQDGSGNALSSEAVGTARALHTRSKGGDIADSAVKNSGTVTSGAWVQLIASTAAEAQGLTVFDSSGYSLELGVGPAASEVRKLIIPPGGLNGFIPLRIPAGSRVSIRAINTTADYTAAEHLLTLLQ